MNGHRSAAPNSTAGTTCGAGDVISNSCPRARAGRGRPLAWLPACKLSVLRLLPGGSTARLRNVRSCLRAARVSRTITTAPRVGGRDSRGLFRRLARPREVGIGFAAQIRPANNARRQQLCFLHSAHVLGRRIAASWGGWLARCEASPGRRPAQFAAKPTPTSRLVARLAGRASSNSNSKLAGVPYTPGRWSAHARRARSTSVEREYEDAGRASCSAGRIERERRRRSRDRSALIIRKPPWRAF